MIDFYMHKKGCYQCDDARDIFKSLVVAHNLNFLEGDSLHSVPFIREGTKEIKGHSAIKVYLSELKETVELWNQFQGDSCYIDKDKKIC